MASARLLCCFKALTAEGYFWATHLLGTSVSEIVVDWLYAPYLPELFCGQLSSASVGESVSSSLDRYVWVLLVCFVVLRP